MKREDIEPQFYGQMFAQYFRFECFIRLQFVTSSEILFIKFNTMSPEKNYLVVHLPLGGGGQFVAFICHTAPFKKTTRYLAFTQLKYPKPNQLTQEPLQLRSRFPEFEYFCV